jgi:uncharacterized protein YutE (UPF0331/DUF86 family)
LLAHHYESIDGEVVFGIFKTKLADFDNFEKYILEYVKKTKFIVCDEGKSRRKHHGL